VPIVAVAAALIVSASACSRGGDAPDASSPEGNNAAGSEAAAAVPESVEEVLVAAGAEPNLAGCYQLVLEREGVEAVGDLREMSDAIAGLGEQAQLMLAECVSELNR
jgi:hypothetical protein